MTKVAAKVPLPRPGAGILKGAGLALIVGLAALAYVGGLLRPVEDGLAQVRFHLLERPPSHTITVVEIDAASLRAAGAWPWSRARMARAIDNLTAAGAELVAFDVDFSATSSEAADRALEASIRRRPGTLVLPTFVQPVRGVVEGTSPLAALSDQAILASVNVPIDSDGRVRRYRYGFGAGEGGRASMGAILAGVAPDRTGSFLLDYGIRVADIDHLSFEDVYTGRFDPALVRGRKILVGSTALELGDGFATPKRGTLPGVYIHALAYESLHAGRTLRQLQLPVLFVLAGACAYFLRPRRTLDLSKMLRRHGVVAGGALFVPLAAQAALPVSLDASPILLTQALCLVWVTRAELKRRTQAVIEAREAHLLQLATHMRKSRNRIRAANKKLQAANEALDKALKARTEFLATTSHEIRTPLNGVLGMTQVILSDRSLTEGLRDKVGLVHNAGEAMLALVDDILDVAKIEAGALTISPVEMDLHKLLEDTAQLWSDKAHSKGLTLRTTCDGAPVWIEQDATRLRQVVFNLMSNAIKFTEAGQVGLSARVETRKGGEVLALEVSDSGIGIPAEHLDEIFEPFRQVDGSVTRKYGGTGLGLAICRQLALAMGGQLSVRSALGAGSVFTVRLPLRRVERQPDEGAAEAAAVAETLEASAVLLIEANPLAQSLLKAALAPRVASIEIAASTDEALWALRSRPFDLILAEGKTLAAGAVDAPGGLAQVVAGARAARISVLWAGPAEDLPRLLGAGADHVARKPISPAALVRELQAICSAPRRQAHDPGARGAGPSRRVSVP